MVFTFFRLARAVASKGRQCPSKHCSKLQPHSHPPFPTGPRKAAAEVSYFPPTERTLHHRAQVQISRNASVCVCVCVCVCVRARACVYACAHATQMWAVRFLLTQGNPTSLTTQPEIPTRRHIQTALYTARHRCCWINTHTLSGLTQADTGSH